MKHLVKCTVWNLANVSYDFVLIMAISLNFLPFQAIFSFGKGKKSHGITSGKYGRRRMTIILFLGRNSEKAAGVVAGHEFSGKLTYVPTLSQNTLKWPKWNSQNVKNFMDSDSSVSMNMFLYMNYISIRFAWWWISKHSASSTDDTPFLSLEKHSKTCILPTVCCPEATFNILIISVESSYSSEKNVMLTCCSSKSAIF